VNGDKADAARRNGLEVLGELHARNAIRGSSALPPKNYLTVDHLEPVDTDRPSRSTFFQPVQDEQGRDRQQEEKRDHRFPFSRSRSTANRRSKVDIWPCATIAAVPWAWSAMAGPSNLGGRELSATTGSIRSQIWGHASGIPTSLRPILGKCRRLRSLEFMTACEHAIAAELVRVGKSAA
jgi:hypothetical protein